MDKMKLILIPTLLLTFTVFSQLKIGDNPSTINPNSILELETTNKGLLIARVALTSTTNSTPLSSHIAGMLVYNTATTGIAPNNVVPGLYYNNGSNWILCPQTPTSGLSAYQVAVNNGYVGSESQWIASLQGATGPTGATGSIGLTGATGQGVPSGGTAGQVLSKINGNDYNTQWVTINTQGDIRLVNTNSHISQDAGVGSNGTSAGNSHVIAIGLNAGNANSGANNVFIGSYSGWQNTSGLANTFVGYASGEQNTTGQINTFIGNWAGKSNNTGSNNAFFGHYSGGQNTSGNSNTFIGYESGKGNTVGISNTALGTLSLSSNASANYNTALGMESLKNTNNGSYNTAVGFQSGLYMTNASNNTAIGKAALLYNTTGNNNIGIGINSGDNNTTGNNNIAIGNSSSFPSSTGSNQLNIGNIIYGNNINGSGATLSTGNIGIGTTTPNSKLQVAGGKITIDSEKTLTINPTDNFTYDSKSMSHYGMGWFNDSWNAGGSTTWISGYAGFKIFTQGSLALSVDQAGNCKNVTGSWSSFSDERIKSVKSTFTDGLNVINQIKPVRFTYNENAPFKSSDIQIGIIAQDLEKIAPYMVKKSNTGAIEDLREVNTQAYVFLLINAVKEQQIQIEELKNEIKSLKK